MEDLPTDMDIDTDSSVDDSTGDHPFDNNCIKYCCSDFRIFTENPGAQAPIPDISNEIHPLFHRNKFVNSNDGQYFSMGMALQLATRMLADDRATRFILSTADGNLHLAPAADGTRGPATTWAEVDARERAVDRHEVQLHRYSLIPQATQVSPAMRRRAKKILEDLAETLDTIKIVNLVQKGLYAFTAPTDYPPLSGTALRNFPRGKTSFIRVSRRVVYAWLDEPLNSMYPYFHYLKLAETLVHEVAHVLHNAVNGPRHEEVFYEDSCCNEAGLDLTSALFGGSIEPIDMNRFSGQFSGQGASARAVMIKAYPSHHHSEIYEGKITTRWPLDKWMLRTRLPFNFITTMFTNRFWDDIVHRIEGPIRPTANLRWPTRIAESDEYEVRNQNWDLVRDAIVLVPYLPGAEAPTRVTSIYEELMNEQRSRRRLAPIAISPDQSA